MEILGRRLKELRDEKSLTQADVSEKLEIPRGTYAHYELGKRDPDYTTLSNISKFYCVSIDYLLGNSTSKFGFPKFKEWDKEMLSNVLKETHNKHYDDDDDGYGSWGMGEVDRFSEYMRGLEDEIPDPDTLVALCGLFPDDLTLEQLILIDKDYESRFAIVVMNNDYYKPHHFGSRLKFILNHSVSPSYPYSRYSSSYNSLSVETMISTSRLNEIIESAQPPNNDTLTVLVDALRTSKEVLLSQNGPKLYFSNNYKKESESEILSIPILGTFLASSTTSIIDTYDGYLELKNDITADFALKVIGDSMSWSGIHEGDTALLVKQEFSNHGDLVAVIQTNNDKAILKFYIIKDGLPKLRSANPSYDDIPMDESWQIVGVVTSIIKRTPSLDEYQAFLKVKSDVDAKWNEVILTALDYGLDPESLKGFIGAMHMMIKSVKK